MSARIQHVETSGTFSLDGGTWEVNNNVWVIGDDSEVIIIDPAHDLDAVDAVIHGRKVQAIVLTHAHDDHCSQAVAAAKCWDAPVYLHAADLPLWDMVHPDYKPDYDLAAIQELEIAGIRLQVLHTPGHSPGSVCFYAPELAGGVLLSGDTLFQGGPGATGRSYSDFDTIIRSIQGQLLVLPADTRVLTGHGPETTIGQEAGDVEEWIARGH
ncbi:MAG: MBL fold metallo-hydrolase [Corynebacterium sp.]|nr:MBL fold metallo-hydrolase [Corynebacterium sp.]